MTDSNSFKQDNGYQTPEYSFSLPEESSKKEEATAAKINDCTKYNWHLREDAQSPGDFFIRYDSEAIDHDHKGKFNTTDIVNATLEGDVYTFETQSGSIYKFDKNRLTDVLSNSIILQSRYHADQEEYEEYKEESAALDNAQGEISNSEAEIPVNDGSLTPEEAEISEGRADDSLIDEIFETAAPEQEPQPSHDDGNRKESSPGEQNSAPVFKPEIMVVFDQEGLQETANQSPEKLGQTNEQKKGQTGEQDYPAEEESQKIEEWDDHLQSSDSSSLQENEKYPEPEKKPERPKVKLGKTPESPKKGKSEDTLIGKLKSKLTDTRFDDFKFSNVNFDKEHRNLSFDTPIEHDGEILNVKFRINNLDSTPRTMMGKFVHTFTKGKDQDPKRALKNISNPEMKGTIRMWVTAPNGEKVCVYEAKKGSLSSFLNKSPKPVLTPRPDLGWDEYKINEMARKLGLPTAKLEERVDINLGREEGNQKKPETKSDRSEKDRELESMKAQNAEDRAKVEHEKLGKLNAEARESSAQSDTSASSDDNISRSADNQKIQNDIDEVQMSGQHIERQEQRGQSSSKAEKAQAKNDPAKKPQNGKSVIQEDTNQNALKPDKRSKWVMINAAIDPAYSEELKELGARYSSERERWFIPPEKDLNEFTKFLNPPPSAVRNEDNKERTQANSQTQTQVQSRGRSR